MFHSLYHLILSLSIPIFVSGLSNSTADFQYKGVSIGGWLVLEPYITPSLFKDTLSHDETEKDLPVDEYHYCKKLGHDEAAKRLDHHWSTFYKESDFKEIRDHGLNMVRIPVGYWSFKKFDGDPYVSGAQDFLDKAIEWCSKHDLKVLIDLHGAPNTQNGFDNSGLRNIGYPGWQNKTEYVDHTIEVLQQIYEKYGTGEYARNYSDTIIGVEVLNEPLGPKLNMTDLKKFYVDSYNDARDIQSVNNTLLFHDAFQSMGYWDDFFSRGQIKYHNRTLNSTAHFENIVVDHHHYEVFGNVVADNVTQHLKNIENYAASISKEKHPAIVGEWSAALTDCAPWLNGIGLGTRYEGTAPYDTKAAGKCSEVTRHPSKWSGKQKKDYRRFVEMQLYQYNAHTKGWIFWCWKTQGEATEWDFRELARLEIIPQPLDDYKYIKNGKDTSGGNIAGPNGALVKTMIAIVVGYIL
ncbi:Glucan 1,3-beta-glucosidase 2 [Candida parapsilosis]|uniref:glucan 1,3-beta-glucosidase n=2 Tax=Candida parapsilosis TaxID=5480 RepID=G8B842_CANPC|nr:uncharacterized protein CPAR2_106620 [Candida parapsilosis]KAF6048615.1 Glucan 1,3-beta-glucosidase 2 [Candida parapsilosis]KAF6049429.1 Glucan 1,3-beta-glucosidase 2 [Candida parapsilosis]KAF6057280.1 Glucan 1,3-beta-glucosidase 2 [Candida parapsilosis]KAF6066001.1 Glucan 1,3-beta-glucosidase 2 [Candida parapsilosis]KAI5903503.1 Glucan 1 [Candida parapsilosis]